MTLEWHQLLSDRGQPMWMAASAKGTFSVRRCGPQGRQFALRLNGAVLGIYPDASDAKHEAARIADLQEPADA